MYVLGSELYLQRSSTIPNAKISISSLPSPYCHRVVAKWKKNELQLILIAHVDELETNTRRI